MCCAQRYQFFTLMGVSRQKSIFESPCRGYITLLTRGYVHCARRLSSFEQDIKNISAQRELVTTSERDIKAFFGRLRPAEQSLNNHNSVSEMWKLQANLKCLTFCLLHFLPKPKLWDWPQYMWWVTVVNSKVVRLLRSEYCIGCKTMRS